MNVNSPRSRILLVVLVAGVLPVLLSVTAQWRFGEIPYVQHPVHEWFELTGTCIALGVALLLLLRVREGQAGPHLLCVAAALTAMGLMDGVHSVVPFGPAWSWLRHGATALGGLLFATVWLAPPGLVRQGRVFVLASGAFSLAASLAILHGADSLPAPFRPAGYSAWVKGANVLGGIGFLASFVFFLRRYRRSPQAEDLVLAGHTLLFGMASLLFGFAHLWAADWWVWHGVRLLAYAVVLIAAYESVAVLYRQTARQAHDLEDRVAARTSELARSEERLRLAQQAARVGSFEWNIRTNVTEWSRELEALHGLPPGGYGGRYEEWSARVHPDDLPAVERRLQESLDTGAFETEWRIVWPDGTIRWMAARGQVFKDDAGKPLRMAGVNLDITERKQAEQQLARDLDAMRRLRELGTLFVREGDLEPVLAEIVDAAIAIAGADFGNIQLLDAATGDLRIAAHRGFEPWWLEFWNSVTKGHGVCGTALERRERVIVEDVEQSPIFIGTPALDIQRRAGVRAVQFTPLVSRSGEPLGMFSTHYKSPRRPDDRALRLLDLLARQAADIIERTHAESALRESEERFRAMFDRHKAVKLVIEPESGAVVDANAAAVAFYGYSRERLCSMRIDQINTLPPAEVAAERRKAAAEQRNFFVFPHRLAGGEVRWVEVYSTPISVQGRPLLYSIIHDITERKEAEAAAALSRKTFFELIERAPFGVYVVDAEFRIAMMNAGSQDGAFRNVRPAIGRDFAEAMRILWPEPVAAEIIGRFRHTLETGEPYYSPRFVNPRADVGVTESYEWELHRMRLPDGRHGVICYYYDSTKLREAEEAVRQSEEKYRNLFRNMAEEVHFWQVVRDGAGEIRTWRLLDANPPTLKTWGRESVEDIRGKTTDEIFGPGATDHYMPIVRKIFEEGRPHSFEDYFPNLDRYFRFTSVPFGECFITTGADITGIKKVQKALEQANASLEQRVGERTAEVRQQAEQLRALASELSQAEQRERRRLATILHDHIQQLLVAARFQLDLVKRADAATIHAAVQGVQSIIGETIEASRSLTVELSPPILHQSGLAAALGWLAHRLEEKHQIRVRVLANQDDEPAGEAVQVLLFEAVRELLLNVVKHSGAREAHVSLSRTPDGLVRLIVEDEGAGFEPSEPALRKSGAFGLFSIQQRLAHLGGRMEVESAPGRGARVTLLAPPGPLAEKVPHSRTAGAPAGEHPALRVRPKGRRITVLLVDDHAIVRQGLRSLLQFEPDIQVAGEAADGSEAVEMARRLNPDVVIMDINMPVMNGVEATRRIVQEMPHVHVIGLSMHVDADIARSMQQAGAVGYFSKGGPSQDLLESIRTCCAGR